MFAKKYGMNRLMDRLENNEKNGVLYHREGIVGDYDEHVDMNELIGFIENGLSSKNT